MTGNQFQALKKLNEYTGGTLDPFNLSGPRLGGYRAALLSILNDGAKVQIKKAGVNALWAAFKAIAPVGEDCLAGQIKTFQNWAKGVLAEAPLKLDGPMREVPSEPMRQTEEGFKFKG